MFLEKAVGGVRFALLLSSQGMHAPHFSGYGLMIQDAYVRKKERKKVAFAALRARAIPRVCTGSIYMAG